MIPPLPLSKIEYPGISQELVPQILNRWWMAGITSFQKVTGVAFPPDRWKEKKRLIELWVAIQGRCRQMNRDTSATTLPDNQVWEKHSSLHALV
jgi:hypothetical protein